MNFVLPEDESFTKNQVMTRTRIEPGTRGQIIDDSESYIVQVIYNVPIKAKFLLENPPKKVERTLIELTWSWIHRSTTPLLRVCTTEMLKEFQFIPSKIYLDKLCGDEMTNHRMTHLMTDPFIQFVTFRFH